MKENIDKARDVIYHAVKYYVCLETVLGFFDAEIKLTDDECIELAKESVFSYMTIRTVFD